MTDTQEVRVLKLTLHDTLVGYLAGFQHGLNVLTFDEGFKSDQARPTFTLTTHPKFPKADDLLAKPWMRKQRLNPTLSNLMPEGALRELLAQALKVHVDNEFEIFAYLGRDLPGALIALPVEPDDVPAAILSNYGKVKPVKIKKDDSKDRFSLAGVQMKFSMKENDGRYHITQAGELGDWIVKTPSTKHRHVPLNEFTAMSLAAMAGIVIPEIKLVSLDRLDKLPQINLPDEKYAFAIRRFDRNDGARVHMEDFAQVLMKYAHEKYGTTNYENIGKIIYQWTGDGLDNAQQFARRLLANILLANGDAHLKNWSLLYTDKMTPELAPAYDIVTTSVYIDNEREYSLNLGGTKDWYAVTMAHFQSWADRSGVPWRVIKANLDDAIKKARDLWPNALKELPMDDRHKEKLLKHWKTLQPDFRITAD